MSPSPSASLDLCGLILTYNEEANIGRTLAALSWLQRVLVVDSFSSDRTLDIISNFSHVSVVQRVFDTHATQWNYGLSLVSSEWVLTLDSDYLISESLRFDILRGLKFTEPTGIAGFRIPFIYCVQGHPLRSAVLPPRIALFRVASAVYVDDGHTQDLRLSGRCSCLTQPILHDDRKPLSRWLDAQRRYLPIEADKLLGTPSSQLSAADRLRKHTPLAPVAVLLLCLLFKGGLLDGWRGWFYAVQRLYVELLLWLLLTERRRLDTPS